MMLVSLEEAKAQVREVRDAEDADITLKIKAASLIVVNYLQDGADSFLDSNGNTFDDSNGVAQEVPEDVMLATLVLVGIMFRNRDGDEEKLFTTANLPPQVTALIYHRRQLSIS
jgi:hypothetical protein